MEYIVKFRVFRSDEGWRYGIEFVDTQPQNRADPEHVGPRTYALEGLATTAGLRVLGRSIAAHRRTHRDS